MSTFKLQSSLRNYSRGIKLLAERAYIEISQYSWGSKEEGTYEVNATLTIRTDKESYYLSIPDDKLVSVIDRLTEIKNKKGL